MENVKELIKQKEQALLKEKKDLIEATLYVLELIKLEKIMDSGYYCDHITKELKEKLEEYESKITEDSKVESEETNNELN